jgi:lipoprotein-anchoring transpeptidase ErfK/SrfK
MKLRFRNIKITKQSTLLFFALTLFTVGCVPPETGNVNTNSTTNTLTTNMNTASNSMANTVQNKEADLQMPVTLPVLDAMFADESFAQTLKSKLGVTDEEVDKLKKLARDAVGNLNEDDDSGSTRAAVERSNNQIRQILGDEKSAKFLQLVRETWSNGTDEAGNSSGAPENVSPSKVNSIPTDTRVVVNAPAYRMDLFQEGKLVKSYKIGIGYPEFPLPSGIRKASTIIFNPTWTPPDEAWVKGKIQAGKTVEAGSKDNPLGPIKIPIGLPSLIHGGKAAARLGGFASHGCVGLTNGQIQDFALNLSKISDTPLTELEIKGFEKQKTETKDFKLAKTIPVELRYETIVVEDGKLKIYRDVYERGTNTEENLRKVFDNYGVSFDELPEAERTKILQGLKQMAVDATGQALETGNTNSNVNSSNTNSSSAMVKNKNSNANANGGAVTRNIKGKKEVMFVLAALKGKGYPAPVNLAQ